MSSELELALEKLRIINDSCEDEVLGLFPNRAYGIDHPDGADVWDVVDFNARGKDDVYGEAVVASGPTPYLAVGRAVAMLGLGEVVKAKLEGNPTSQKT